MLIERRLTATLRNPQGLEPPLPWSDEMFCSELGEDLSWLEQAAIEERNRQREAALKAFADSVAGSD